MHLTLWHYPFPSTTTLASLRLSLQLCLPLCAWNRRTAADGCWQVVVRLSVYLHSYRLHFSASWDTLLLLFSSCLLLLPLRRNMTTNSVKILLTGVCVCVCVCVGVWGWGGVCVCVCVCVWGGGGINKQGDIGDIHTHTRSAPTKSDTKNTSTVTMAGLL